MTVFCVVATANHWWLDGIVATVIVVGAAWLRVGLAQLGRVLVAFWQTRVAGQAPIEPEPEPATV
jgi:hypothetical protein